MRITFAILLIAALYPIRVQAQSVCHTMTLPRAINPVSGETETVCVTGVPQDSPGRNFLRWINSNPTVIDVHFDEDFFPVNTTPSACLTRQEAKDCFMNAVQRWMGICPETRFRMNEVEDPFSSTLLIDATFGANLEPDFGGRTSIEHNDVGDIRESHILINNSTAFKEDRVWVSCPQTTFCKQQANGRIPFDFCSVMQHELGHSFGLEDLKNSPCNQDPTDLMFGHVSSGCNGKPIGWSSRDVCYFCLLYCPQNCDEVASVRARAEQSDLFRIKPNPATENLTIHVLREVLYGSVQIVDLLGRNVIPPQSFRSYDQNISLDIKFLEAGTYYVRVVSGAEIQSQMLTKTR